MGRQRVLGGRRLLERPEPTGVLVVFRMGGFEPSLGDGRSGQPQRRQLHRQDAEEFLALAAETPIETVADVYPMRDVNFALGRLKAGEVKGAAVLTAQGRAGRRPGSTNRIPLGGGISHASSSRTLRRRSTPPGHSPTNRGPAMHTR